MTEEEEEEEKIMEEEEEEEEMSTITTILLPQDILMDILLRFPVQTLLTIFKLVCKAWHSLIQDPNFIKTHLNRGEAIDEGGGRTSRSNNNNSTICKSGNQLFQLDPPYNYDGIPIAAPKKLDFDWDLSSSKSRLIGSCNGLLCIKVSHHDETLILLNPSTKKYKVVLPPKECPSDQFKPRYMPVAYGFGCCHNISTTTIDDDDEYKVVIIARFDLPGLNAVYMHPSIRIQIDIYSMSSNSWRNRRGIKDIPYEMSSQRPGIFVSGAFHWVGRYRHVLVLISFDIRDEDFGHIEMPPCDDTEEDMILMNFRGCLGVVYISPTKNVDLEIWVMKKYGIKESWTRECVIRSSNLSPHGPHRAANAFGLSFKAGVCLLKGDQILINEGYGRLALYDMNTKKIDWNFQMVDVSVRPSVDIIDYIETLVSLKSSLL